MKHAPYVFFSLLLFCAILQVRIIIYYNNKHKYHYIFKWKLFQFVYNYNFLSYSFSFYSLFLFNFIFRVYFFPSFVIPLMFCSPFHIYACSRRAGSFTELFLKIKGLNLFCKHVNDISCLVCLKLPWNKNTFTRKFWNHAFNSGKRNLPFTIWNEYSIIFGWQHTCFHFPRTCSSVNIENTGRHCLLYYVIPHFRLPIPILKLSTWK